MEISNITQGDVFWAELEYDYETRELIRRPVVIIQNNISNKYSPTVVVLAITSAIHKAKLPLHVELPKEISGLKEDSVVLAEQVRTIDKRRLKTKVCSLNNEYMLKIQEAMLVLIGYSNTSETFFKQKYENYKKELTKPLVLTEGKTDAEYIKTAWEKLFPDKEMYFDCKPCGVEVDEKKRNGGTITLRQALIHLSTIENRPIIGLFDNDKSGNNEFDNLKENIFKKNSYKCNLKKHVERSIWGMLLPVPKGRELFVTNDDVEQRYLVIEHYFSDEILKEYKMYGKNILGTSVFKVNNGKNEFSKKVKDLDSKEFVNFKKLFKEIEEVFNNKV